MNNFSSNFQKSFTKNINHTFIIFAVLFWIMNNIFSESFAQVECTAWGNVTGIRVDGELMKFETSLRIIKDWTDIIQTAKEKQEPAFTRNGSTVKVTSKLDNLSFIETVKDSTKGTARITFDIAADSNITMLGAYFCIELPNNDYSDPQIEYIDPEKSSLDSIANANKQPFRQRFVPVPVTAQGVNINSKRRRLKVTADRSTAILVQKGNPFFGSGNTEVYFTIIPGNIILGTKAQMSFVVKVSGEIDDTPVNLKLDASNPGRTFEGIGGNFRIQNPVTDPPVIDYCLNNLTVAWGRVELPWNNWQHDEDIDPLKAAESGDIDQRVIYAMQMAQKLAKKNMPLIISTWYPPAWAVLDKISLGPRKPDDPFGNPLNPMKMRSIIKSITSYLIYLKDDYGVEPALFSFNESDPPNRERTCRINKTIGRLFCIRRNNNQIAFR
jgi:hypothetical protein